MHFLTLSACGISSPGGASPRDYKERSDRRVQVGARGREAQDERRAYRSRGKEVHQEEARVRYL